MWLTIGREKARSRVVHGFSNVWQRGFNEGEAVFVLTVVGSQG